LIALGSSEVKLDYLARTDWSLTFLSLPILFSAYGYHNVIPTLCTYMNRNVDKLWKAVIIGSAIPFIVYTVWQWLIIGSVTKDILDKVMAEGMPATETLNMVSSLSWLSSVAESFSFFALTTSLLGVSLAMLDFLADGLQSLRTGSSRAALSILVFMPPLFFAWNNPTLFITALEIAGGFGEAILNGLIPVMMVWVGRYYFNLESKKKLPGGRWSLLLIAFLTICMVILETSFIFQGRPH
jgi:tyrosine-specific transport protein